MDNLYKLHNPIKHYEWGSPNFIPRLMGIKDESSPADSGIPWAEMWMGSDPRFPSLLSPPSIDGAPSSEIPLGEFIGAELPFLFKLLAVEKPLSIQVHPNKEQAYEGFNRENAAGMPLDAPNRNYKDPNHKPEIICALSPGEQSSPFTGMCGFRTPDEIYKLINGEQFTVGSVRAIFGSLADALKKPGYSPNTGEASSLKNFLETLLNLSSDAKQALTEFIISTNNNGNSEWRLMQSLARLYPGDPAIIAPLYLNIFYLEPGEAVFLQAGVPHAYIHGYGVELMANSDNVLRGGLSSKYIDIPEMIKVIDFSPLTPHVIQPVPARGWFTYPIPCKEFSLSVMRGAGGAERLMHKVPLICIVSEGEVSVSGTMLKQGESAFIPPAAAGDPPLVLQGHYTLYIASVPESPDSALCLCV